MKKLFISVAVLAALASVAGAAMDSRDYSSTLVTTAASTQSFTLRGTLNCVYVDLPTGKTATVAVATSEGTVFTKADIAADTAFYPAIPMVKAADGAAATFVGGTNDTANAWYAKPALAGLVTVTVTPKAETTGTNTYGVRVIYDR
jgi:hypothetical protein